MWLLDAATLRLVPFNDDRKAVAARYAILSHTWEEDELSFQDMTNEGLISDGLKRQRIKKKAGFTKVQKCCAQAIRDGYLYVWVDTCCINKDSSAELSEAINSMYRWYRGSAVCYAPLSDIRIADEVSHGISGEFDTDIYVRYGRGLVNDVGSTPKSLRSRGSRWFTRGWTLQELLAPNNVIFFDSTWDRIGNKSSMADLISHLTGIPVDVLKTRDLVASASVATRMSWAATRETTRVEDAAYSLLGGFRLNPPRGIFNVNMPMLYGEGERAFSRLQEEIIKISTDHSLLAWRLSGTYSTEGRGALFAPNLTCFARLHNITGSADPLEDDSFELSNKGLRIILPVIDAGDHLLARLNCRDTTDRDRSPQSVFLKLQKYGQQTSAGSEPGKAIVCALSRDNFIRNARTDAVDEAAMVLTNLVILREDVADVLTQRFVLQDYSLTIEGSQPAVNTWLGDTTSVSLLATAPRQLCQGWVSIFASGIEPEILQFGQFCRQEGSDSTFRMYWRRESRCENTDEYSSDVREENLGALPPCSHTRSALLRGQHRPQACLKAQRSLERRNSTEEPGVTSTQLSWVIRIWITESVDRLHSTREGLTSVTKTYYSEPPQPQIPDAWRLRRAEPL